MPALALAPVRAALEELGASLLGKVSGSRIEIGAGDHSLSVSLADAAGAFHSLPAQAERGDA